MVNGHATSDNWNGVFTPGERIRLRIINASAMTIFNVRMPGLPMTVVQADGLHVQPLETDEFQMGVAETYDVIIEPTEDRAYAFVAESIDRSGQVVASFGPRPGMRAAEPEMRAVPTLTMRDMGMDHGAMGHGDMAGMDMSGDDAEMDHSTMDHGSMDHDSMDHSAMGHGNMQMDHSMHSGMDMASEESDARSPNFRQRQRRNYEYRSDIGDALRRMGSDFRNVVKYDFTALQLATWLTLWAGSVFNTYPKCQDPATGSRLPWCDAMAVLVGAWDVLAAVTIAVAFVWVKRGGCGPWKAKKEAGASGDDLGGTHSHEIEICPEVLSSKRQEHRVLLLLRC